jgi:putative addiction module antidote
MVPCTKSGIIVIIDLGESMATTAKILGVGSSLGIVLTKDVVSRLKVEKGDTVFIHETPHGIELTPYDKSFADEMAAGRRVMRKHRDVLRRLAE